MTARVLFQVRNRRGLGHLMRVQNVAHALRERHPHLDLAFHAATAPSTEVWDASLPVTDDTSVDWLSRARDHDPHVVVYDTVLPPPQMRVVGDRCRYVFVLRRSAGGRADALLADPFLRVVDAIVVPHVPAEFGHDLPADLVARTEFVGTVVRRPDAAMTAAVRAATSVGPGGLLLTSTVGGGGFREQADRFFESVLHTARCVSSTMPHVRHVVVLGPNYSNQAMAASLAAVPGVEVRAVEPRMTELLAASDLVLAEGGYNTVNEVRVTRVPAVFVPSERGLDDQVERVRHLERLGAASLWSPSGDMAELAGLVVRLLGDAAGRRLMRCGHAVEPLEPGNERAADVIARVASMAVAAAGTVAA